MRLRFFVCFVALAATFGVIAQTDVHPLSGRRFAPVMSAEGAGGLHRTVQHPGASPALTDHAAIQYATRPIDTHVSKLNHEIQAGNVHLAFDPISGYLPALLTALDVPIQSQLLVFSKTSLQAALVSPPNPRALFFTDSLSIGWIRGGDVLEVAVHDRQQGVIFYTLEQKPAEKPQLTRDDRCLMCHLSWDTLAVPGLLALSTFPMSDDKRAYASGVVVDQRTPVDQRWGGWFVTGNAVPAQHLGNAPVVRTAVELSKPVALPPHLRSVDGQFDTSGYPSRYSDVAALMVLGHQTHMTNLLTHLGWEARLAEYEQTTALNRTAAGRNSDAENSSTNRVRDAANDLVDYLLFIDEAPIVSRMEGSSGFAESFSTQGPRDRKGRSLRQLDLGQRLMRYPCSYMIYSEAFDALPSAAKDAVYRRLWQVLSGQETAKPYARLSLPDRQAIVEILRDTKKNLPDYFQAVTR